ncbi:hypothetical protein TEA_006196 [Camellia sinensis var. sinensis]|uniref:Protein kinase domain-containing protein n=1 Tax=Camellia sinensis var. sinensis TaxID=542762 RepID=A0A4S4DR37_CAMSN|nr:hypothetical protein TEA_006196 [Camellia sinensis var. sinensis]
MRVQIALDAAKGLEYIHLYTKPYYIHRDVKSSNILLDSAFHAKIADFGLVKLLEHAPDADTAASRIVGTFGYLAPEYVRDGRITTKSDVYSFGVVLMELLTGQPALSRDASPGNIQYVEHRSLVEYMLSVLENNDPFTELSQCIDPTLTHYHKDSLLQDHWYGICMVENLSWKYYRFPKDTKTECLYDDGKNQVKQEQSIANSSIFRSFVDLQIQQNTVPKDFLGSMPRMSTQSLEVSAISRSPTQHWTEAAIGTPRNQKMRALAKNAEGSWVGNKSSGEEETASSNVSMTFHSENGGHGGAFEL